MCKCMWIWKKKVYLVQWEITNTEDRVLDNKGLKKIVAEFV